MLEDTAVEAVGHACVERAAGAGNDVNPEALVHGRDEITESRDEAMGKSSGG